MDLTAWLKTWLARHPLKAPSDADSSRFTAQVMARVRAEASSLARVRARPEPASWAERLYRPWSRLTVSLAAAAVALAVVSALHPARGSSRLTSRLAQESEVLAELDEPVNGVAVPDDVEHLAEELEQADAIVLAEAPQSDDSWVADTLQLLDQLDEELPDEPASGDATSNEHEWLDELQTLDESELAARS